MKRPISPAYTFTPGSSTLNLSGISSFVIGNLFAVTNLKTGALVYAPLAGYGYSALSGTTLTLAASMAGMSGSDALMIIYDDGGKPAEDASVQAVVTAITTLISDVASNHADLTTLHGDLSTTLHADLQSILTKLGTSPAQSSDVAAIVTKLGTSPAQSSDVQAVITKLNNPAQTSDVAAVTAKLGAAPAQTNDIQALGTLLQSLLTTVQNQRAESLWTDDSGTYYVRVDVPGASTPNWYVPTTGAATSAPGTGARPAAGATVLTTTDTYRALNTAASGGAYIAGDLLKHIETLDPKTGVIIGQFWVNASQNTTPAAANITSTDLQLLDGQSEGAATLAAQTAGNSILSNLQTALALLHTDITTGNSSLATLHTDTGTTLHTDLANLLTSLGTQSDPNTALSLIGLTKALLAHSPALGVALAAASTPVAIATDQFSTLAKDGTDMTLPNGVTAPSSGGGIRGWLSASWVQLLALATAIGTQADAAAASATANASLFGWVKWFAGNDATAIAAISTANTREGALPSTLPDAFANSASGKLGALAFVWQYTKAAAASLVSLIALLSVKSATGTLGALNASVPISGGPYGAVGYKLTGTSVQTLSAFGTRDGTNYDVPLGITTEVAGGGSTSGQTLAINGAGPFFGYIEAAGCVGVALVTSAYTSGSLAAILTATPTARSIRVRAPQTDPVFNEPLGIYNTTPPTLVNGQATSFQMDAFGNLKVAGSFASTGVYNASAPTLTNGQSTALQTDASGNLKIAGTFSAAFQGKSANPSATPVITAAAYAAGNEVGGLLSFTNAVDAGIGSGVLQSIRISAKTALTAGFKLYLFNANPSNTTWTDKTAPSINVADIPALMGVYSLSSPDSGLATHTLYELDNVGKSFVIPSGTSLYGILVTTGTPTFASTSDVSVFLGILKD